MIIIIAQRFWSWESEMHICVTPISEMWSFEFEAWKIGGFVKGR